MVSFYRVKSSRTAMIMTSYVPDRDLQNLADEDDKEQEEGVFEDWASKIQEGGKVRKCNEIVTWHINNLKIQFALFHVFDTSVL